MAGAGMSAVYWSRAYRRFQNILESVRILEVFELNTGIWLAVTISSVDPVVSPANQN
jgi:hypothetical protein